MNLAGRMLLCTRERSIIDSHNHSSLQRQFSHGHSPKIEDGEPGTGASTRVSHFLPTSRRIVQFSNGKVCTMTKVHPQNLILLCVSLILISYDFPLTIFCCNSRSFMLIIDK